MTKNFAEFRNVTSECNDLRLHISSLFKLVPLLSRFSGQTFVIKCGNNHLHDAQVVDYIAQDIVLLRSFGINVILVHGGGPKIEEMIKKLGVSSSFVGKQRVTSSEIFDILEMVLRGRINVDLTAAINHYGGSAVGFSGREGKSIIASKLRRVQRDEGSNIERIIDLGMVGEPSEINKEFFNKFLIAGSIPVVAPIGVSNVGRPYAVNADVLAAFIAIKLKADRLILMSDVDGIIDNRGELLTAISSDELKAMISKGQIAVDIEQKAKSAVRAVCDGVFSCHIINGFIEHSIVIETVSDQGIGTMVYAAKNTTKGVVA